MDLANASGWVLARGYGEVVFRSEFGNGLIAVGTLWAF